MIHCHRILPFIKTSFFLGLFVPFLCLASEAKVECVAFKDMGKFCYPVSESASGTPLLVFIRGLVDGNGQVGPTAARMTAANAAIDAFKLKNFARPILVMGSSHLGLDQASILEIESLYQKYNLGEFRQYTLASHSGGYAGLFATLHEALDQHIPMPKSLVMLDNFYSIQPVNTELFKKVLESGVGCGGFLTDHNLDRYQRLYKHPKCTIIGPDGQNHNGSVYPTLVKFLE